MLPSVWEFLSPPGIPGSTGPKESCRQRRGAKAPATTRTALQPDRVERHPAGLRAGTAKDFHHPRRCGDSIRDGDGALGAVRSGVGFDLELQQVEARCQPAFVAGAIQKTLEGPLAALPPGPTPPTLPACQIVDGD